MFLKTANRTSHSRANARKAVCMLGAATLAMAGFSSAALSADSAFDKPLFGKPLWGDKLFPDRDTKSGLSSDVSRAASPAPHKPSIDDKIATAELDADFRRQIRACANWLTHYGVRNNSRFPGLPNDEGFAAQIQLQDLVPNNPYNFGYTHGNYRGIPAVHNKNGSAMTGSPVWSDGWTEHLQAQNNGRVLLSINHSINPDIINQWAKNPPMDWSGQAPGTINCIGNGQGLFVVWGAGRDGKPIHNPANGLVFLSTGSTSGFLNDQAGPNEGH